MLTTITYRGVIMGIKYEVTDLGDIIIEEVWVGDVELACLVSDDDLSKIRREVEIKHREREKEL
jgi:hypothetical protein